MPALGDSETLGVSDLTLDPGNHRHLGLIMERERSTGDVRVTLGIAACLSVFAVGWASSGQVGQVQETGPGTHSIGVRPSHGLGASSQENKAMDAAVDKAGQYCHAKGEKLLVTTAVGNTINFRCLSDSEAAQH